MPKHHILPYFLIFRIAGLDDLLRMLRRSNVPMRFFSSWSSNISKNVGNLYYILKTLEFLLFYFALKFQPSSTLSRASSLSFRYPRMSLAYMELFFDYQNPINSQTPCNVQTGKKRLYWSYILTVFIEYQINAPISVSRSGWHIR